MAINPNLHKRNRAQKFAAIAFIFGAVIFLLSGVCTLGFEIWIFVNPPIHSYDQAFFTFWNILAFGAAGFVPAGLLILLALIHKKHGGTIWRLILMGLIMAVFIFIILMAIAPIFFDTLR